jgi:hypothetical protein
VRKKLRKTWKKKKEHRLEKRDREIGRTGNDN